MKIDAQTKRKIEVKKKDRKEALGELTDYQNAREVDGLSVDEIEVIDRKIDRLKTKIKSLEDDLEELGDISTELVSAKKRMTAEQEKVVIENLIKENVCLLNVASLKSVSKLLTHRRLCSCKDLMIR